MQTASAADASSQTVTATAAAATAPAASATSSDPSASSTQAEAAGAAVANTPLTFPASGKFSYDAIAVNNGQPRNGSGSLQWTTDGKEYQLRLESTAMFVPLLSQTSVGSLGGEGLQPLRYADKRFNRSERAAHFRRDEGVISFSGNQSSAPLQRGAQDRLSVLVQMAALVAGNPGLLERASNVSVQVVSTQEVETWVFSVEGMEAVQLPAGQANAIRVVRNPRKEFDPRLELWLAPSLGYLPARVKQTDANGNTFELQLRSPALR